MNKVQLHQHNGEVSYLQLIAHHIFPTQKTITDKDGSFLLPKRTSQPPLCAMPASDDSASRAGPPNVSSAQNPREVLSLRLAGSANFKLQRL